MKIAFIGDRKGRVHHNRFKVFRRYIPQHSFDFFSAHNKQIRTKSCQYDIVYYASFPLYKRNPVKHPNVFASATSWKCLTETRHRKSVRRLLAKFKRVSANNLSLARKLRPYRKDIVYIPNGVDINLFCPAEDKKDFSRIFVGWVGNINRREKNYHILRWVKSKVKPRICIREIATKKTTSVKRLRSHRQMCEYYQNLHFFLVCSSYEGTPNPALEAASCGVPIITTIVGNMPELIDEGVNGFFVECNNANIVKRLNKLRHISSEKYGILSKNIRKSIVGNWSWKKRCQLFEDFFRLE